MWGSAWPSSFSSSTVLGVHKKGNSASRKKETISAGIAAGCRADEGEGNSESAFITRGKKERENDLFYDGQRGLFLQVVMAGLWKSKKGLALATRGCAAGNGVGGSWDTFAIRKEFRRKERVLQ